MAASGGRRRRGRAMTRVTAAGRKVAQVHGAPACPLPVPAPTDFPQFH